MSSQRLPGQEDHAVEKEEEERHHFVLQLVFSTFFLGTCNAPKRAFDNQCPAIRNCRFGHPPSKPDFVRSPATLTCLAFCAIRVTHDRGSAQCTTNPLTPDHQRAIARIVRANPPLLKLLLLEVFCIHQLYRLTLSELLEEENIYSIWEGWYSLDKKRLVYMPETRPDILSTYVTRQRNWEHYAEEFVSDHLKREQHNFTFTHHMRFELKEPDLDTFMYLFKNPANVNKYRWWDRCSRVISWLIWIPNPSPLQFDSEEHKKQFLRSLFDHVTTIAQHLYAEQLKYLLYWEDHGCMDEYSCRLALLKKHEKWWLKSTHQDWWCNVSNFRLNQELNFTLCEFNLHTIKFKHE